MGDYGGGYNNNNNYQTSYGAQGGAGDGGFMNTGSQDNKSGGKQYGEGTLRPVTIKQLNNAEHPHPDAHFRIDSNDIDVVTFVAQIRNISTQATNHTYKLDDGTGTIEVKQWIDPEESTESGAGPGTKFAEGQYARIFGNLKSFNNKRHMAARPGGVRAVTDHNEVQCHLLEATAVHLTMTRGPPGQKGDGVNGAQTNGNGVAGGAQGGVNVGGRMLPAGLSGGARRVYQCLASSHQSNEGLNMHDVGMQTGLEIGEVQRAGEELLAQGVVYTTVDDQTWAILDDIM